MKQAIIYGGGSGAPRVQYGRMMLKTALEKIGYKAEEAPFPIDRENYRRDGAELFWLGTASDDITRWLEETDILTYHANAPEGEEAFTIETCPGRLTALVGGSDSGVLYACQELARCIEAAGEIPREISVLDAPAFTLRGVAVGLQKTEVEPPRLTYEYPLTRERFPWLYDRAQWEELLDRFLEDRCNILYLWTGQPFSSLVRLEDYPNALEVDEEQFKENQDLFHWLTAECDRRGIWMVVKFYSIHIPLPLAEQHHVPLLQNEITPLNKDYTFKAISAFAREYIGIGLMVCLGEALRGNAAKTAWFAETVIPAIKDGLAKAGITREPPVILRGHDCDPLDAMEKALPLYGNLYTMWKYNGEGLTTYQPRGDWQKKHQALAATGGTHILNVHILADLEPFRFEAPLYIQKCVQAGQKRLSGNGLHLYPLFYWDWPYSPDKTAPRLKQIDRDRLWFQAWMRYAWQPWREEKTEALYWAGWFASFYKTSAEAGSYLLEAMECAGQCAPRLLGRFGITEGNRQTYSLGMTMSQFTNVERYRPNLQLWNSVARVGEPPAEYVRKELAGESHLGETPPEAAADVALFAERALECYRKALTLTPNPTAEMKRTGTDVEAIAALSRCYVKKLEAALLILRYKLTMDGKCAGDYSLLEKALIPWEESLAEYRKLVAITNETYLYANSMRTPQRKIPFPNGKTYGHFADCLPEYERELANFRRHLDSLKAGKLPDKGESAFTGAKPEEAVITVAGRDIERYRVAKGEPIFSGSKYIAEEFATELEGLEAARFTHGAAIGGEVDLSITFEEDSLLLVGYINARGLEWARPPELETNTHADERGGLLPVLANAMRVKGCPGVNVHAFRYEKGTHRFDPGLGGFLILGALRASSPIGPRDAGLSGEGLATLDWMYED